MDVRVFLSVVWMAGWLAWVAYACLQRSRSTVEVIGEGMRISACICWGAALGGVVLITLCMWG
jgi:hypothetical protein